MKIKCTKCKKKFECEKGKTPYYNRRIVCTYCFEKLKRRDKTKRNAEKNVKII